MTTTSETPLGPPGAPPPGRTPSGGLLCAVLSSILLILPALGGAGCQSQENSLHDGFFTAHADSHGSDGWREFLTIYVSNGQITIVEYDAVNESGYLRSWDMDYQLDTSTKFGDNASRLYISYQNALLTLQDASRVQPLMGSRRMHQVFTALAAAAVERARLNDKSPAYVRLPENEFPGEL